MKTRFNKNVFRKSRNFPICYWNKNGWKNPLLGRSCQILTSDCAAINSIFMFEVNGLLGLALRYAWKVLFSSRRIFGACSLEIGSAILRLKTASFT